VLSFLTVEDLVSMALVSKDLRKATNSDFLWTNLGAKLAEAPKITSKNDYGLQKELERRWDHSVESFARSTPANAYRVMQSSHFSQQLPAEERMVTSHKPRSRVTQLLHGFAGFGLGLGIGLLRTFVSMLQAFGKILWMILSFGIFGPKTSLLRSLLGITLFPLVSLIKSAGWGSYCGWQYGLDKINKL